MRDYKFYQLKKLGTKFAQNIIGGPKSHTLLENIKLVRKNMKFISNFITKFLWRRK